MSVRVLITDDHPVVRQGLRQILEDSPDIVVDGEAGNGREMLKLVRSQKFDVVLLDLAMPGTSGLDLIKQLKAEKPRLPVLVLTMHSEDQYAIRVLRAGADGYLTKDSPPAQLIDALKKVAGGGKYVSRSLAENLALRLDKDAEKPPHETLSDREFQVLCRIAAGKTVSEIAAELSLSVKTISTYRTRILEKMRMTNNAQLTQYAVHNNLGE